MKRFSHIVIGSRFHGEHSVLHLCIACHDDKGNVKALLVEPSQCGESVVVGKSEVRENQIALAVFLQQPQGSTNRCGFLYFETFLSEPCLNHGSKCQIVFYNQYLCHLVAVFMVQRYGYLKTLPKETDIL